LKTQTSFLKVEDESKPIGPNFFMLDFSCCCKFKLCGGQALEDGDTGTQELSLLQATH
jgi:hypothetical protein